MFIFESLAHSRSSTKLQRKEIQIEGRKDGEKKGEKVRERKNNEKERGQEKGKEERRQGKKGTLVQETHLVGRLYFPKGAATRSPLPLQYDFHTHPLRYVGLCFLPVNPGRLMAIVEVPQMSFKAKS